MKSRNLVFQDWTKTEPKCRSVMTKTKNVLYGVIFSSLKVVEIYLFAALLKPHSILVFLRLGWAIGTPWFFLVFSHSVVDLVIYLFVLLGSNFSQALAVRQRSHIWLWNSWESRRVTITSPPLGPTVRFMVMCCDWLLPHVLLCAVAKHLRFLLIVKRTFCSFTCNPSWGL